MWSCSTGKNSLQSTPSMLKSRIHGLQVDALISRSSKVAVVPGAVLGRERRTTTACVAHRSQSSQRLPKFSEKRTFNFCKTRHLIRRTRTRRLVSNNLSRFAGLHWQRQRIRVK